MDNAVTIKATCTMCHKAVSVTMSASGYTRWLNGEHIQDALKELTPGEREMLISGVCEPCFDELFKDEEEL